MDDVTDVAATDAARLTARHVLITAIGLNPEPVALSIAHHNPDVVIFLVSKQSMPHVAALEPTLQAGGRRFHRLLVVDISDWQETYEQAQRALELALAYQTPQASKPRLTVEPTFGTKIMSAGLVLACAGYGATWSYVRGSRDERGMVVAHEKVLTFADPIRTRVQEHWQTFQEAWNGAHFADCERTLRRILTHPLPPELHALYSHLRYVVIGLEQWQRGHYEEALDVLEVHLSASIDATQTWADATLVPLLGLLEQLEYAHLPRLRAIVDSKRASWALLPDLLASIRRLAAAERYDLAALTLRQLLHVAQTTSETPLNFEQTLGELELSFVRHGVGTAQAPYFEQLEVQLLEYCQMLGVQPAKPLPQWHVEGII
jgi:CRISPR-associated protein (TIGR02710 family)